MVLCTRMSCVLLFNVANHVLDSSNSAKSVGIQNITYNFATWVCHKLKTRLLIVAFYNVTTLVLAFYTTDPEILHH